MPRSSSIALLWLSLSLIAACGDDPIIPQDINTPKTNAEQSGDDMGVDDDKLTSFGVAPPPAPAAAAACPSWRGGQDLSLCLATYLGWESDDEVTAPSIAPDGSLIIAGVFPGIPNYGLNPTAFGTRGDAIIARLDPQTHKISGWARVGDHISGVVASPVDGTVIASGAFGLLALEPDLTAIKWQVGASGTPHVKVGFDGTIALLSADQVNVIDPKGVGIATWRVNADHVLDVAVDANHRAVFAGGYNLHEDGTKRPFVRAYSYTGELLYALWEFDANTLGELSAPASIEALTIGKDGKLHVIGHTNGADSALGRKPTDASTKLTLVTSDDHNTIYNLAQTETMTFVARLDPATGHAEAATYIIGRGPDGQRRVVSGSTIAAREDGVIVMTGQMGCCIPAPSKLEGASTPTTERPGPFVLSLSSDFETRHFWTTFDTSAEARILGVDVWGETIVATHLHPRVDEPMITHAPIQDGANGGAEAHIATWPGPPLQ